MKAIHFDPSHIEERLLIPANTFQNNFYVNSERLYKFN